MGIGSWRWLITAVGGGLRDCLGIRTLDIDIDIDIYTDLLIQQGER